MTDDATGDPWASLARFTPARIALGRTGSGLPTHQVLAFALAHALARDAVHTPFDVAGVEAALQGLGFATRRVASRAPDRDTYLRRPDLGRRLDDVSRTGLTAAALGPVDVAIVVADGLSSTAIHTQAAPFLAALRPWIAQAGWSTGPVVIAGQARVALGDEVGALMRAHSVVLLVGERPGLSSPDSLGLYLTYAPRVGRDDSERNCISNIRPAGLAHDLAAFKAAWLLRQALSLDLTGVRLKDESDGQLVEGRAPPALPPP
jgi:ethanolamine ammonia-lyase small subunit